jgi:hypothetical protein
MISTMALDDFISNVNWANFCTSPGEVIALDAANPEVVAAELTDVIDLAP